MAKAAGRKNQGAWFRTNKELVNMSESEKTALQEALTALPEIGELFNALESQRTALGVEIPLVPSDYNNWVQRWMEKGIPLQIYMGKPTFTSYTRSGEAGAYEYAADLLKEYQDAGEVIRKITGKFLRGRRQFRDLYDVGLASEGNPGGYPDGQDDPPPIES